MKKIAGFIAAFILGILPGFFIVFNSVFSDSNGSIIERLVTFVLVIVSFGIPGAILGYIGYRTSWRWGIPLSMPSILILAAYSFKEPGLLLLLLVYAALTIVSSIISSYLGSRLAMRKRSKF